MNYKLIIISALISFSLLACKKTGWTSELKSDFVKRCKMLVEDDVNLEMENQEQVDEFCDCMLEMTIHEYSPIEVEKQTDNEIKQRFENCEITYY